ncbi:hypothetical protein ACE7GA_04470 [Roseomonas sp. CCTCC AB2023176]|uniref:hypothetical protein n=1 Tax=Roseomonas sp. CCTCC AB2023176 TaxID=3342640 RepID=UPI0035E09E18
MHINGEQADVVRRRAHELVTGVLPFTRGDPTYQKVCAGYSPGYGTSCTFLPHWMLLQLGVSKDNDTRGVKGTHRGLINREDASRGTKIVPGDGVSVIANSKAFVRRTAANKGAMPQRGDIVIIQADPYKQSYEHVFVFLGTIDDGTWDTGESGQARSNADNGAFEALRKQRKVKAGDAKIIALAADGIPDRYVQGWLDISLLDYVPELLPQ